MSKKALTINLENGNKKLDVIIDDVKANNNVEVTYSGKFIDDNLLSTAHGSNLIGKKTIDEANLSNKTVISYDENEDKLIYTNVDNLVEIIDCGTF